MTVLSTTSSVDLAQYSTVLVNFSRDLPGVAVEEFLKHEFKWFIGSRSGCSCDLRHLCAGSEELGFSEPVEWFPEETEDIEATRMICAIIRRLVSQGEQVDCVDGWATDSPTCSPLTADVEVDLSAVKDTEFRFFERHRFTFA